MRPWPTIEATKHLFGSSCPDERDRCKVKSIYRYRLEGTPGESFVSWGHEYVRHLAGEVIYCYHAISEGDDDAMEIEGEGTFFENKKNPPKQMFFFH